jgi:hypothetical protein
MSSSWPLSLVVVCSVTAATDCSVGVYSVMAATGCSVGVYSVIAATGCSGGASLGGLNLI